MSKVTPGPAKKKNFMEIRIYMTFDELVDAQKQFSELAGHFLVKGEVIFYILIQNILTVQSHPEKKFPNLPIFNYFTACYVCLSVHPIRKAVHEELNVIFPKAAWRQRHGREEIK